MNDKAVEQNAAGKRAENSSDQLKQRGFAAGVRAENGHNFARARLKASGFEREERCLRRISRVSVADLLDGKTDFRSQACGFGRSARNCRAAARAHATLRRRR